MKKPKPLQFTIAYYNSHDIAVFNGFNEHCKKLGQMLSQRLLTLMEFDLRTTFDYEKRLAELNERISKLEKCL